MDEATIAAALERLQIAIESTPTESESDDEGYVFFNRHKLLNLFLSSIPGQTDPVFARLEQAWYNDDIDDDTYFQLHGANDELIYTALERLGIGNEHSSIEENSQER